MGSRRRSGPSVAEALFASKPERAVPYPFVLDALESLDPHTNPMFGCTAIYVGERIVAVLRERPTAREDNGMWLATTREHHESLRRELPSLASIGVLAGGGVTGWQKLPADGDDFEAEALRACELIAAADPRIGKVPKPKSPRSPKTKAEPAARAKPAAKPKAAKAKPAAKPKAAKAKPAAKPKAAAKAKPAGTRKR